MAGEATSEATIPSTSGATGNAAGKMNVLYLNHSGQVSGAEQSLRALLWQFRRAHVDVEPVVALPGAGPFADILRDGEWNVTFAPLRRLQRPQNFISGMAGLVEILRTAPFLARLARQTDSHLIHSNSTTAHLAGGLAAERAGKPALWHARDMVSLERVAPALAQRATWVIAISKCVAERLEQDGVPPGKIRVIHNGLDPDEWRPPERSRLRGALGAGDDAFIFGCASQLVPWKNHKAFIDAAAQICQDEDGARARFVILGGDLWGEHQGYVQELRDLVKKHGLQERFNFIPHQSDNVDALAAFDALVLCSREEPFGRVLIEAMALQKPVVAYAQNGPTEIVTHLHDGMLVAADEADGLAYAMRRVLSEGDLREHLSHNARETVMQKFHISDSAQQVLDIYREVLG
ncbi:MAG TPA: glycosyltransferase family 4 protein [Abditibacteriaceae bacterium]|nr:glycosyltransferase family 4 protein [Abditibacteriaceae bacterium]